MDMDSWSLIGGFGWMSGATSCAGGAGKSTSTWLEAELEQVCVPLPPWAIRAGARETIYFNPAEVNVAIVTCGGLCPGLNDVVQGLVNKLVQYGVPDGNILGIRWVPRECTACHQDGSAVGFVVTFSVSDGSQMSSGGFPTSWCTTVYQTTTSWVSGGSHMSCHQGAM
jgi:hypothetical protein